MQIAKLEENGQFTVGDHLEVFPQTSFSSLGPSDEFMSDNNCYEVCTTIPFDPSTQKLVAVDPYLDGDIVYTVVISDMTEEEIEDVRKSLVPTVVSMRQARLALLQSGLLTAVNTAINAAEEAVQIEWEYATEVKRDHALVQTLSVALGLTDQQLDELFILAAGL